MTTTPGTEAPVEAPVQPTAASTAGEPLRASKPPVGTGASPLVAQLVALALICLGAVAVQHLLVETGAVTGTSWLQTTLDAADGVDGRTPAVLTTAIALIALGLVLLGVALKPRPRKGIPLATTTGAHLRRRDLRRLAEATVENVDGVTGVDVAVTRRRVRVVATSVARPDTDDATRAAIGAQLGSVLDALEHTPRLTVSVRRDDV